MSQRARREERAAAEAKCEKSRRAHLGLAEQYQLKMAEMDSVNTPLRASFG